MECKVWSADGGTWTVEGSADREIGIVRSNVRHRVWSMEWGVEGLECGVWSVGCGVGSVHGEMWSVKCEVHSAGWGSGERLRVCQECEPGVEWGLWSGECGVGNVQWRVEFVGVLHFVVARHDIHWYDQHQYFLAWCWSYQWISRHADENGNTATHFIFFTDTVSQETGICSMWIKFFWDAVCWWFGWDILFKKMIFYSCRMVVLGYLVVTVGCIRQKNGYRNVKNVKVRKK